MKPKTSEQKARILHLCFQIWNVDAEADWDDLDAAIHAVLSVNNVIPNCLVEEESSPFVQVWIDEVQWKELYEKEMNNVATGKSFRLFCNVLTKFYKF